MNYIKLIISIFLLQLSTLYAVAMNIHEVKSPGGISAWLVEDHSLPLITLRFAFEGGSSADPDNKKGLANLLSSMLDEGAGDLDSQAFQERIKKLSIKLSFDVSKDYFYGNLQTLKKNDKSAFELLKMALLSPRFDNVALDRMKSQIVAGIKNAINQPNYIAKLKMAQILFEDHPYAYISTGKIEDVKNLSKADLDKFHATLFARDNLKIAVVGDISPKELATALDDIFGSLPKNNKLPEIPEAKIPLTPKFEIVKMDIPQSVVNFGNVAIKRDDKDFVAAFVMNYVLGGGSFSSRLTDEIREKRGLTYSVYSYLSTFKKAGLFLGGAATKNSNVSEMVKLLRAEIKKIHSVGVTEEELKKAKKYLTGSYPLRFDTSTKIASQLLAIQMEGLGIDYVKKRNDLIDAVTMEDINRVAKRILHPDNLVIVVVGNPEGNMKE